MLSNGMLSKYLKEEGDSGQQRRTSQNRSKEMDSQWALGFGGHRLSQYKIVDRKAHGRTPGHERKSMQAIEGTRKLIQFHVKTPES